MAIQNRTNLVDQLKESAANMRKVREAWAKQQAGNITDVEPSPAPITLGEKVPLSPSVENKR